MTKNSKLNEQMLMHKLSNGGQTNLCQWFEKINDVFCEEQVIEEHTSFEEIKSRFHDDFHKRFLCTIHTFLFKSLIDKGIVHIVKPWPLFAIPSCIDWNTRKREWECFLSK